MSKSAAAELSPSLRQLAHGKDNAEEPNSLAQLGQWSALRTRSELMDLLYLMSTQQLPDNGADIRQLRNANRTQAAFAYVADILFLLQQGEET